MNRQELFFNGVCGESGGYATSPLALGELAQRIRAQEVRPAKVPRAVEAGIDAMDLASAGWGVIFSESSDPAIRRALAPLLEHRRQQASEHDPRLYREMVHLPDEPKRRFLPRYKAGPGPVKPQVVPYYLLLVGGPEQIPFALQTGLEVQYAVGRLAFERVEDYARYADSVVEQEQKSPAGPLPANPPRTTLFGVQNESDPATALSVQSLVLPLANRLAELGLGDRVQTLVGPETTRARLGQVLSGPDRPDLLFTASHAVLFPSGHQRQRGEQGALVCRDWPGPEGWRGRIPEDFLFAATDVPKEASLSGLITFHFACSSVGTPLYDAFQKDPAGGRRRLTETPFIARLPQRLLANPKGSALAVIGHVERAWPHSFLWDEAGSQVAVFATALQQLLSGQPVGLAMEEFGVRYAELATELLALRWELAQQEAPPNRQDLEEEVRLWTAYQDARHYIILGDPAVRLPSVAA